MKYAVITAMMLAAPVYADDPCEAALAYVDLINAQQSERFDLLSDARSELSLGIPMLSSDAMRDWWAGVSSSIGRVTLYEMKATRKRIGPIKRLSEACR